jgi:hypothetical protein
MQSRVEEGVSIYMEVASVVEMLVLSWLVLNSNEKLSGTR